MRPTKEYLQRKFAEFNDLCFNRELPPIRIELTSSKRTLGQFVAPKISGWYARDPKMCHIRVSTFHDFDEREIEDTLIHEMIHYHLWYTGRRDTTGPHGANFKRMMEAINREFGRNITVRHKMEANDERSGAASGRFSPHYILVTYWRDGRRYVTLTARTRIFEMHEFFSRHPEVERLEWYFSVCPCWDIYPRSRSYKLYSTDGVEFDGWLEEAQECECDGKIFRPKKE